MLYVVKYLCKILILIGDLKMNSWEKLGKSGMTEIRLGFECVAYVMTR